MPTSTWRGLETFAEIVRSTESTSFLDIGVGNGKWGYLFREYSDVWNGRFLRSAWTSVVDGIEIYPAYIDAHQRAIYSHIYIGDACDLIGDLGSYDMIYAGDVIEHIPKGRAVTLLRDLCAKARKVAFLSVPIGEEWLGKRPWDNQYEDHVSSWEPGELRNLGFTWQRIDVAPDGKRRIGLFAKGNGAITLPRLTRPWFMPR